MSGLFKNKYIFFLSAALLLFGFNVQINAQQNLLIGRIVDAFTNQPVPFATVFVDSVNATISDQQGEFRLSLDSWRNQDTLRITCVGYDGEKIQIGKLQRLQLNTIYLHESIYEMDAVEIREKKKRPQKPEDIVQTAINFIPFNYPLTPVIYKGYYREYLKDGDKFVNLFESILDLQDYGISSSEPFNASLEFKKLNESFRIDTTLFKTYDNKDKFVPMANVRAEGKNELVVLKSTDPVKNEDGRSVSFIDNFRKDFIRNHSFQKVSFTWLNDRLYYVIPFVDRVNYARGISQVKMHGTIYINADDFAVKKINYQADIKTGLSSKKLYELNVEYAKLDDKYYLHYISYNNLFKTKAFAFSSAGFNDNTLILGFNHLLNPDFQAKNRLTFTYNRKDQPVKQVKLNKDEISVSFSEQSDIATMLAKSHGLFSSRKRKHTQELILSGLRINFDSITDLYGNTLSPEPFKEYYQYREFFVHEKDTLRTRVLTNTINKDKPVFEGRIKAGGKDVNTGWFNTPLIEESTRLFLAGTNYGPYNRYLLVRTRNVETNQKEAVYIQTDRELYAPGDTLWFKGYVRNKSYLTLSQLSQMFYVELFDSAGVSAMNDRYLISNSDVEGQFELPLNMKEGFYTLVGYSSWMRNFKPEAVFRKRILVQREVPQNIRLQILFDKNEYYPGDSVHFTIKGIDPYNQNFKDIKFNFQIEDQDEKWLKGEGITKLSGDSVYSFKVPDNIVSVPNLLVRGRYEDNRMEINSKIPVNNLLKVDFFPESGHALEGIKTNIAFKAVTAKGKPVDIKGDLMINGSRLEKIQSEHDGMGKFSIRYNTTDSVFLKITEPLIFEGKKFAIPEPQPTGFQMLVNKRNDKLQVQISGREENNDTLLLTLMIRDALMYFKVIMPGDDKKLNISVQDMSGGIGVLTLFNKHLIPQAERLCYIHDPDNFGVNIETDKESYRPRDSVRLKISLPETVNHPEKGSWALSVVDNQLCMTDQLDEPDITTSFLLSPELKGQIYNLNSYHDPDNPETNDNIDLLLMTQGWRDYIDLSQPVLKKPENKDMITGFLYKQPFGSEKKPAAGTLTVFFGGESTEINVGPEGRFMYLPDYSPDKNSGIFMSAKDEKNTPRISIVPDGNKFTEAVEDYYEMLSQKLNDQIESPVYTYQRFEDHFSYNLRNHHWLEEVKIVKTIPKKDFDLVDLAIRKRTASKEQLESAVDMEMLWQMVDPNFAFSDATNPYYCIDGILQYDVPQEAKNIGGANLYAIMPDNSWALHIDPRNIKSYVIIRGDEAQSLYGFGVSYVIDIRLKENSERESYSLYKNPVSIPRFAISKKFYEPVYDTEAKRNSQIPDLRKTIFWDPHVQFDEKGNAFVTYYNGDRYTRIRCIFEGIDNQGNPIHGEHSYRINIE